jgi:hypothetical protein
VAELVDAVIHCRFEETDAHMDEVVKMTLIEVRSAALIDVQRMGGGVFIMEGMAVRRGMLWAWMLAMSIASKSVFSVKAHASSPLCAQLLVEVVEHKVGDLLTDESVWEVVYTCFINRNEVWNRLYLGNGDQTISPS